MSGGSISWAAQLFGVTEGELIARGDGDTSASVPIYLPYIAGERAPLWRSDIRGSFTNISVAHGAGAFAQRNDGGNLFRRATGARIEPGANWCCCWRDRIKRQSGK